MPDNCNKQLSALSTRAISPSSTRSSRVSISSLPPTRSRKKIRQARDCPAEEVITRLYAAVKDFSKGTEQNDDLTAVVLKRKNIIGALKDEAEQSELVALTT